MQIQVNVTQGDIDGAKGCVGDTSCPIKRALTRDYGTVGNWIVGMTGFVVRTRKGRVEGRLPRDAMQFVDHFDLGYPVYPLSFPLEVPDPQTW